MSSTTATERTALLAGQTEVHASNAVTEDKEKHFNLAGLSGREFWVLCFSMWTAIFLSAFDTTIVATLVGPLSSDFNATNLSSWLGTSYMLSVCCFTPIYGRLCNIIGRQASLLIALFFFGLGTLLCAIAPSMNFFLGGRAIAGMGGGGLTSVVSTIVSDLVPLTHRGIFQGYGNILFGLGYGLGGPLGGIINDTLSWRWAFYIQLPFLVLAAGLTFFKIRYETTAPAFIKAASMQSTNQTAREKFARIDFLGSFLLAGFIGSILLAISLKTSAVGEDDIAWSDPLIVGLFAAGAIMLVALLWVEARWAKEPVVPLDMLKRRTAFSVAINNFLISIVVFAVLYTVPLFLTAVVLMSAAETGRRLIPSAFVGSLSSLGAGFVVRRTKKYYWLTFIVGIIGVFGTILLTLWKPDSADWRFWWSVTPINLSMGAMTTTTIVALIADVGRDHVAVATSLSYVFRTSGQVLGVSLSGALIQAILASELKKRITGEGAEEIISSIRQSSALIHKLPPHLQQAAVQSYEKAIHTVFVVSIVIYFVGTLVVLGMREVNMDTGSVAPVKAREDEAGEDGASEED